MKKVSIYGIGNFGYAILKHLSNKIDGGQFSLCVYDRDEDLRESIRNKRTHTTHHKGIRINEGVKVAESVKDLISQTDILILAVASPAIKKVLKEIRKHIDKKIIILNTAKALDSVNGERFSVIIERILSDVSPQINVAVLSGGTIAKDLFNENPLGVDIACKDIQIAKELKDVFMSNNLNVYTTKDIAGVEYAGAFKNVVSILAGIMNGAGFSYGSETHIISRLSGEIKNLSVTKLGAKNETFSIESQCWGNDMFMSATGNTRNREFGVLIGGGYNTKNALEKMTKENKTVEGINTTKVIKKIIKKHNFNAPILSAVNDIILKNKDPKKTILSLMSSKII